MDTRELQTLLSERGYYRIPVDGLDGPTTQKAQTDFIEATLAAPEYPNITADFLNEGRYLDTVCTKKQIVLHHTASGPSAVNVKEGWNNQEGDEVATDFIIGADGSILRVIPRGYWAWHLGVGRQDLDSEAIGIEVCNWGWLTKDGERYLNYLGEPVEDVYTFSEPYRGNLYFENYTDAQFKSLDKLLRLLIWEYKIPVDFSTFKTGAGGIFEYSEDAMNGKSGIHAHGSFRTDKTDMYPHPKLLALLKSLKDS